VARSIFGGGQVRLVELAPHVGLGEAAAHDTRMADTRDIQFVPFTAM